MVLWFSYFSWLSGFRGSSLGSRRSYGSCGCLGFVDPAFFLVIRSGFHGPCTCTVVRVSWLFLVVLMVLVFTCGPRGFLVPVMVLRFSWLSWMSWSVLSSLWSMSFTLCPRGSLRSYGLQGFCYLSWSLGFFRLGSGGCLSWFHENHGKQKTTRSRRKKPQRDERKPQEAETYNCTGNRESLALN